MDNRSSRPRLGPDELRRLRWILGGCLLLLSAGSVFLMDAGCEATAALATAGIALGLVRPDLPARVPSWVHRLAFPAIVLAFTGDLWFRGEPLPAMIRLDLLLLFYRGLTYRKRRDDLQIVILGLFLIVVGGVLTVSPVFAAQILAFTALALGLLATVSLTEDPWSRFVPAPPPTGRAPAWAVRGAVRPLLAKLLRVADWRIIVLGAALFAGVVAVSIALFLAIPRFQIEASFLPERLLSRKARTGFGENIRFGDVTDIAQDDAVAFNVDLTIPAALPPVPYWRMLVLDDYHDGSFRLSPSLRLADFTAERTETLVHGGYRDAGGTPAWTFYLEPGVSRFLPFAGRFSLLQFRQPQAVRVAAALATVGLREEPATMTAYRVTGMAAASEWVADPGFAVRWRNRDSPRGQPLQLRTGLGTADRRILDEIAAGITHGPGPGGTAPGGPGAPAGTVSGAAAFAARAGVWLRSHHGYSLSPRIPPGPGDPLIRWMASDQAGHCELFAGSLVLLARAAGYPARVVVGFKGGSWNAYSGSFTVRNSSAHAWTEIWDAGRGGWLLADALEPGVAEQAALGESPASSRVERGWSARLNGLRVFWYRRIVNFDARAQMDALNAARQAGVAASRSLGTFLARVTAWIRAPWGIRRMLRVLAAAASVAAATAALAFGVRAAAARLGARGVRSGSGGDPIRRSAGRWLRRLDGVGSEELLGNLRRLRYGPPGTWPEPGPVFNRARREARLRVRPAARPAGPRPSPD